ncbi:hypothetical protein Pan216_35210 [Planctomycetes bacterium Pan216]|uniref:DUF1573 domain-containing protein n=1 Tax=Kolteria novifilia TaxID=2527975 RepID=A0A518B6Q7_9BACT|nr:hypothetical protein Pan216_35210 [Planctomycetes bacterium Pan216]
MRSRTPITLYCVALIPVLGVPVGVVLWAKVSEPVPTDIGSLSSTPAVGRMDGSHSSVGENRLHFSLRNHSKRSVRITGVTTTCSCVSETDIEGAIVRSKETIEFAVSANMPEFGVSRQRMEVHHTGKGSPLVIPVELRSRTKIPSVLSRRNEEIVVRIGNDLKAESKMLMHTVEPPGSEEWCVGIRCDTDYVAPHITEVKRTGSSEQGDVRVYVIGFDWASGVAPQLGIGRLYARFNDDSELNVGAVHILPRPARLSPSTVQLTAPNRLQDIVVFRDPPCGWRIVADAGPPAWLQLDWMGEEREQQLKVSLVESELSSPFAETILPLVDSDGRMAELEVFAVGRAK